MSSRSVEKMCSNFLQSIRRHSQLCPCLILPVRSCCFDLTTSKFSSVRTMLCLPLPLFGHLSFINYSSNLLFVVQILFRNFVIKCLALYLFLYMQSSNQNFRLFAEQSHCLQTDYRVTYKFHHFCHCILEAN